MKEFVSHIDYLIQKHDCVIIPDFGGFVLSYQDASISSDGSIRPPKVSVGFNPSLKHNDGLLAESYMTMYMIPYDAACKKIEEAVRRLNTILNMKHPVQIGRLGKLSMDEKNHLTFIPNTNLSIFHPQTFGLSTVSMKRLSEIQKEESYVKRRSIMKRIFAGSGAAVAAIMLFFIASTPVSENTATQKSSFFTDLIASVPVITDSYDVEITPEAEVIEIARAEAEVPKTSADEILPYINEKVVEDFLANLKVSSPSQVTEESGAKTGIIKDNSDNNYFVIIGGGTSEKEVERLLNDFRSRGLTNLGTVASRERTRIYVASFDSSQKADSYLSTFKRENPEFYDAWVYYKK